MEPQSEPTLKLFELTIWVGKDASIAPRTIRAAEVRLQEAGIEYKWAPERDRDVGYYALRHVLLPDSPAARDKLVFDEYVRYVKHVN